MPENFLNLYNEYTANTESPTDFHLWCSLFGVSVALGRRVWVDLGMFQIYPNLYVILVADSGIQRKSAAIEVVEKLLNMMNPKPNLIAQKLSPEFLIQQMQKTTVDPLKNTVVSSTCEGYVIADELKNFVSRKGYEAGMGDLLTALYDGKDQWEYGTISRGRTILNHPLLGLLGGTTVAFLREAIPEEAIGTGVTSRMLLVKSDEKTQSVPVPRGNLPLRDKLVGLLESYTQLVGPFTFPVEPDGRCPVIESYMEMYREWREKSPMYKDPYLSGYASRRWNHVFKAAMCVSTAKRADRVIQMDDLMLALDVIGLVEKRMGEVIDLVTSSDQGNLIRWITTLIQNLSPTRPELLRIATSKMTSRDLDIVIETLLAAEVIKTSTIAGTIQYISIRKVE